MATDDAGKQRYNSPIITRIRLDGTAAAQSACKDSIDTAACAQVITDDFGIPIKVIPARELSPS